MGDKPRLLCVDDEPHVASGLKLTLRKHFDITTANSGQEGLDAVAAAVAEGHDPAFAVVLSDMRMPGMDGARFLKIIRTEHPDIERVLLTGQADMDSAISAVNDAKIFRFLTKPCAPADLLETLNEAAEQSRLRRAEQDLLSQTLRASIGMMTDLLGLVSIGAYNRTMRIRNIVDGMCEASGSALDWDLEIAVLMSQIGCVVLPEPDADNERQAEIAAELLTNIPRLEGVAAMVGSQLTEVPSDDLKTEMLRVAVKFEDALTNGTPRARAIEDLAGGDTPPDPVVLEALRNAKPGSDHMVQVEVTLDRLVPGMELLSDVETTSGSKLAGTGTTITSALLSRLLTFAGSTEIIEPITVLAPETALPRLSR